MDAKTTNRLAVAWSVAGILWFLFALLVAGGCATPLADLNSQLVYYRIDKPVMIVSGPLAAVRANMPARARNSGEHVMGFCDENLRILWVPWGGMTKRGKPMCDLRVLGEEMAHLDELFGDFHD